MALQITKGAVVRQDIEAIPRPLERAPWAVTTIRAVTSICAQQGDPFVGGQPTGQLQGSSV